MTKPITDLLKAGSNAQGYVNEYGSDVPLVNLLKDSGQARHGFHGDEVLWVLTVVHASQHGTQYCGGESGHLEYVMETQRMRREGTSITLILL